MYIYDLYIYIYMCACISCLCMQCRNVKHDCIYIYIDMLK